MASKKRNTAKRRQPRAPGQGFAAVKSDRRDLARRGAEHLIKRAAERGNLDDPDIVLCFDEAMPEALAALVEPLNSPDLAAADYERLLCFGMIAWNASQLGWLHRRLYAYEHFGRVPKEGRREVRRAHLDLVARKRELFPDWDQWIVDFELIETGQQRHLTVVTDIGGY